MSVPTGPGRCDNLTNPRGLLLYNFDIDGDQVKDQHIVCLEPVIAALRRNGSATIIGLADRSGSVEHNQLLSARRAANTASFVRRVVAGANIRRCTAFGERKAEAEGYPDGTSDERFRSVVVMLSETQVPPTPPSSVDVSGIVEAPEIDMSGVEFTSRVFDVISALATGIDVFAGASLAAVAGPVSAGFGIIAVILALPATWLRGGQLARANARIRGYCDALQTMANQFSGDRFNRLPESSWPAVTIPPVPQSRATLERDRQANRGLQEGYRDARVLIRSMDRNPRTVTTRIGQREYSAPVSGRRFLRLLRQAYGTNVSREVLNQINRSLESKGESTFPRTR